MGIHAEFEITRVGMGQFLERLDADHLQIVGCFWTTEPHSFNAFSGFRIQHQLLVPFGIGLVKFRRNLHRIVSG